MNVDYRDRNKPITAEDLIRRYNFEEISKIKKATESNKKGLDKTNAIMDEFIEVTTENIQELQDQVDGNITTWFFSGVPTLLNEPAVNWTTDDEKINHLGDLYYDQETGYAYRFQMTNDEFNWYKLTDADVTEALAIANAAKDTADAKRRVFVTQPTPPYDVGDIWLKDDQELYRCRSARESGSYNPSDWIIGTKYTDDSYAMSVESVLNTFMDVVTTDYATKVLLETTADSINANVATNAQEIHNITTTISNVSGNPIEIEDAINTNPINFQLDGNTEQNGTPTPSSPVSVNNVTGRQEILITDGGSQSNSYEINLGDRELCKIGDYQDYLFKLNNKWYIHKEVGKVNDFTNITIGVTGVQQGFYMTLDVPLNVNNLPIYSNTQTNRNSYDDTWKNYGGEYIGRLYSSVTNVYINKQVSSVNEAKTWLSNIGTIIYYPLATATDTEITDTELINQLNAITLLDGYNHIFATDELVDSVNVDYYRKTPLSNTYVNKTEMHSNLELTSNEIIATTSQNIENSYNQTQEDLNTNYYKKEVVDQLVLNSASGLTNTFSEAGGNNILRNTNFSATEVLETNQLYEYWYGNVVRISNNNSSNGISILLQNDTLYQIQNGIANGNYTLSFYYKKLNPVAECKVVINDKEYELTSENYTLFQTGINNINPIEIHTNNIQLSFISDADNSCEIYDIMLNIGSVKLAYSQNQNETTTSTVNISKGITISSSDRNVKLSATADGIRVKNVNTNETVTDFTETGMTTKSAKINDTAEIVGIYRQKVGDQVWDSLL